ncbi:hypothetical protein KKC22_04385, partial [Myxococcota bacterium]|nr:hypothetical protein [Myxococcota bacterium]
MKHFGILPFLVLAFVLSACAGGSKGTNNTNNINNINNVNNLNNINNINNINNCTDQCAAGESYCD